MFSRRGSVIQYCQSWRDLTAAEVAEFSADKRRAVCHLDKGHVGDHEDKIMELSWSNGGWPRQRLYPSALRAETALVSKKDLAKAQEILREADQHD